MSRAISNYYPDIGFDPDDALKDPEPPEYDLSDPVTLLGVITELRRLNFKVEP